MEGPLRLSTAERRRPRARRQFGETRDLDDVAALLEAALADSDDDPSAVPHALGIIARSQNMGELARQVDMSREGLYKALSADGKPTWSTILKVTKALGLRFELHPAAS